jgi:superfamily II DNA or RNA helicase
MKLPHDLPTILNRKFLFFGADEIHHFRNRGWAQLAAQEISANSLVRIGASATPIYTASKVFYLIFGLAQRFNDTLTTICCLYRML